MIYALKMLWGRICCECVSRMDIRMVPNWMLEWAGYYAFTEDDETLTPPLPIKALRDE